MNHKEFVDCLEEGQRGLDRDAKHKSEKDALSVQIRILREALENILNGVVELTTYHKLTSYGQRLIDSAHAALEATK